MTAVWATETRLAHALEVLQQRYPCESIEIVETFDIAWTGWELDAQGALIKRDGRPALVVIDQVNGLPIDELLEGRIAEYRRLADQAEDVLRRYRQMIGHPPRPLSDIPLKEDNA